MRSAVALLVVTALLAFTSIAWVPLAAPKLVQLPADFDTTITAGGTFEAFAAPGSLARLPTPATLPVEVDLQVKALQADGDLVVVGATQTQKVGAPTGPTQNVTLNSQYVLDRHTTQNVNDPRAWSYNANHPVNRAGTHSFAFGFNYDPAASYPFWDDTVAASYPLAPGGSAASAPTGNGGLAVTGVTGTTTAPADPAWIAALTPLQLPTTLTPEQWTAAGFTVTTAAPSVAVDYLVTLSTQLAIDDQTGGTANLAQEVVTLSARPDPAATGGTPTPPQTVFVTTVSETAASVAADTAELAANGAQVRLARRTIPLAIGAVAVICGIAGAALLLRNRRRTSATSS